MQQQENEIYCLKEEYVDIYALTEIDCPTPNSVVVVGDSHGRFTKLIAELFRYCVIRNITSSQYKDLVGIQQKNGDELSQEDLILFKNIISGIVVNPTLKIIMTDDFVADRGDSSEKNYSMYQGGNDYLNLKFLEVLSKAKVILGICYSNHGVELIDRYERGLKFTESRFESKYDHFFNTVRQLQKLIDRHLVDRITEVNPLIKEHYIAHLQVLVYYRGFIITHAPVGLEQIEKLAKQFNVSYAYNSQSQEFNTCHYTNDELLKIVNEINIVFKNHAKEGTIYKIHDYYNYNPENMLDFFTHNRKRTGLLRSKCLYQANGHDADTEGLDPSNVFTLNSPLGQGRCLEGTCAGVNRVLILKPEQQEAQYAIEEINYQELWQSICDICSNTISAGVNAFVIGTTLNLLGKLLEKYTYLEQQQINRLKSGISGMLILYGLFLNDSDQWQTLVWSIIIRYIVQAMPDMSYKSDFANVATTSTVVSMAVTVNSSNTWTSFFSKTMVRAVSSISAYYGYSLGSTLFATTVQQQQNESEKTESDQSQEQKHVNPY